MYTYNALLHMHNKHNVILETKTNSPQINGPFSHS
jgi:hypothetical protein